MEITWNLHMQTSFHNPFRGQKRSFLGGGEFLVDENVAPFLGYLHDRLYWSVNQRKAKYDQLLWAPLFFNIKIGS